MRLRSLFCVCCVSALGASSALATKYAGESFSVGVGARALGMGGAAVAIPGDVSSGYWNPGALSDVEGTEVGLMHSERFGGVVRYDYLGFAKPLSEGSVLGVTLIRQGIDSIPVTRLLDPSRPPVYIDADTLVLNYEDLRIDSDAEYQLSFSYGASWSRKLSVGGSAKLIYKDVIGFTAYGAGLDAGLRAELPWGISAGAVLRDLTLSPIVWSTGEHEAILPSARLGLAWRRVLRERTVLLVAADSVLLFEGRDFASQISAGPASADFAFGAEVWMAERVALRAGLDAEQLTAGASIRLGFAQVDYAFRQEADFDDTHRVGLRLELGR